MTHYRIFPIDGTGHVAGSPDHVEAASDDEAIALVRQAGRRQDERGRAACRDQRYIEIWDRERLVIRLPADAPAR